VGEVQSVRSPAKTECATDRATTLAKSQQLQQPVRNTQRVQGMEAAD
jgi:hypothetical protein